MNLNEALDQFIEVLDQFTEMRQSDQEIRLDCLELAVDTIKESGHGLRDGDIVNLADSFYRFVMG